MRFVIAPYIRKEEILSNSKKLRQATMHELEALENKELDVRFLVRKYISGLVSCHIASRSISEPALELARDHFDHSVSSLFETVDDQGIVHLVSVDDEGNELSNQSFGTSFAKSVINRRKRWQHLQHAYRTYISSELTLGGDRYCGQDGEVWVTK